MLAQNNKHLRSGNTVASDKQKAPMLTASRETTMSDKEKANVPGAINRRDLLKAAVVAPAAALVHLAPLTAAAAPATGVGEASPAYVPQVFDAHQWNTLHVLSDLILPADENGGSATQAGVPEFIDDWLNLKGGLLKTEVLGGFYTSKIGIEELQYKGNQMLASWDGCPESATSRLGVDYSHWEHWTKG
jgi:hypothetical protein